MKLTFKTTLLIATLLLTSICSKADVKITVSNIKQKNVLVTYKDVNGNHQRSDFKLVDGKASFGIKGKIYPYTAFKLVIKGYHKKINHGYFEPTIVRFYASQNSNVTINVKGKPNGTLTYTIKDDLKDHINRDLVAYNNLYNAKYRKYIDLTMQAAKMKDAVPYKQRKSLKRNAKYLSIMKALGKEKSGENYKLNYVKRNSNLLSSSLLWEIYSSWRSNDDSPIAKQLKKYPRNVQNEIYYKFSKERLAGRSRVIKGKKVSNLTAQDKNGKTFSLSSIVGKKYILLDFWGTWCGACVGGMPHMSKFYKAHKDQIEFVSVCCNDKEPRWLKFLAKHPQYNWIHVLDQDRKFVKEFVIDAFPTKIILDKSGKIIYRKAGEDPSEYKEIEKLLK